MSKKSTKSQISKSVGFSGLAPKSAKEKLGLIALEQRILLDAAGFVTGAEVAMDALMFEDAQMGVEAIFNPEDNQLSTSSSNALLVALADQESDSTEGINTLSFSDSEPSALTLLPLDPNEDGPAFTPQSEPSNPSTPLLDPTTPNDGSALTSATLQPASPSTPAPLPVTGPDGASVTFEVSPLDVSLSTVSVDDLSDDTINVVTLADSEPSPLTLLPGDPNLHGPTYTGSVEPIATNPPLPTPATPDDGSAYTGTVDPTASNQPFPAPIGPNLSLIHI